MTRRRGPILRMDVPLAANGNGQSTQAGLGDIYSQAILIPYLTRKFAIGAGSGLTLPTATKARLGKGKWVAAPIVAPLWLFGRKGFPNELRLFSPQSRQRWSATRFRGRSAPTVISDSFSR